MEQKQEEICCPQFDPTGWDNKTYHWQEKIFIKKSIPQFMHMPFPPMVGKTIMSLWEAAQKSGAVNGLQDYLLLNHDPSPWVGEFYLAVNKEIAGMENVKISGDFISKVYDGGYNEIPKFIKEMDSYLATQNKKAKDYYFYYTTCPKCAKKWGHNYIVVFAQV
ncbi:MAG TPA: hypothetical protein PLY37_02995 [Candidatus Pacearchaeota archaeon]|nr:hypothetical protein [Candidatus Pacearchaeota archaeon]